MAFLKLLLSHDPGRLLTSAAGGFLTTSRRREAEPFRSPPYLLALRQGGLRDDLLALAAKSGVRGWFDPPICLFAELPEWLGRTTAEPCGDYERLVLLSRALREAAPRVFARLARPEAFVDALDRLFGELVAEGVAAEDLRTALEARNDRDAFEIGRDADLAACYAFYRQKLDAEGRRDGRDALVDCARALAAAPDALPRGLGGRREIRVLGLQDLRGGWRPLLRALRDHTALAEISVFASVPLHESDHLEVDEVVDLDAGVASFAASLFGGPPHEGEAPGVQLVSAPDADRELEEVARRVRALLDDGVAPARIAVVSRHARPYLDMAVTALRAAGVPVTARRRYNFAEVPVIRSLLTLFAVAREGWTRHGLAELADQPYLGIDLDRTAIDHVGYRRRLCGLDAWERELQELLALAEDVERRREAGVEPEMDWRVTLPPSSRARRALEGFRAFASQARALDERRTLIQWLAWLHTFLSEDPWRIRRRLYDVPEDREDILRLDQTALRGARRVLEEWASALERWGDDGEAIDVAAFEMRLREMLSGDVAVWTETRRGVQVLEGLAAAHRTLDHVFLAGMTGGRFPAPAPRSPLFDDDERRRLAAAGLPLETREVWGSRERALFRSLCAAGRETLTVSWAQLDARGVEVVRSAFIDELEPLASAAAERVAASRVITPGIPLVRERAGVTLAAHGATIERLRSTGRLSAYNGLIEDAELLEWLATSFGESRVWSPTQLEEFARCPWSWFASRLLRLEKLEEPDIDIDPRDRGSLLHDALQRFYDSAAERSSGPVFLRAGDEGWAHPLIEESLTEAVFDAGDHLWLGPPSLRATKLDELRRMLIRYISWEIAYNEQLFSTRAREKNRYLRTGVVEHERVFDDVLLNVGGMRVRFRGRIDRVERGIDERAAAEAYIAAVDYKTSKYSAPGGGDRTAWEDDVVLQVPLYAHALTQLEPGARVARVEYRAIRQGDVVHALHLARVERGEDVVTLNLDAHAKMKRALESVPVHITRIRAGEFPARPAPSCGCPPFCASREICRIPGGPRSKFDW